MRPDALAQAVALVLAPAVQRLVPELDVAEIAASLAPPPKSELGDLAFPCFRLSKALKQPPPKIAQTLAEVLREQLAAALERHHFESLRAESKMGEDEIQQAITEVSLAAIKYGMLARDNNQKIVFDMDKWTQVHGGEGGAALAYVTARSASLLRKAPPLDPALLRDDAPLAAHAFADAPEQALMQSLAALPGAIAHAAAGLRPAIVCAQLYALAKAYNHFQQTCDVIHQSDAAILQSRLLLVQATRNALAWGLSLLGIPAPERM